MSIFKKIIDREAPADIVYEDEICIAIRDIAPLATTHVLVVPKKEIRSMADVTPEDQEILGHLMLKASEIARDLGHAEEGYRLIVNTQAGWGQTVFHLHIHILAGQRLSRENTERKVP